MKNKKTTKFWSGKQGNKYSDRNPLSIKAMNGLYLKQYGISRFAMNKEFLGKLNKSINILEVGANVGSQSEMLRNMGFKNLFGVELNSYAVLQAKKFHPHIDIIRGSGFNLPFKDKSFDLVFTSGLLIHIDPKDLKKITSEIYRVSKKYIWGLEYFSLKPVDIIYHNKKGLLFKRNFMDFYVKIFPQKLRVIKEKIYHMTGSENETQMFLLEKKK